MPRFVMFVLGILLAAVVRAEVIEVPLPDLVGAYGEHGTVKTTMVNLPSPPSVINNVSLRVVGNGALGQIICALHEPTVDDWPYELVAVFRAEPGSWFSGGVVSLDESGPFTSVDDFRPVPPIGTTWDFLLDGEAELTMDGFPAGIVGVCTETESRPSVVIETVTLIVDAEFTLPAAPSTWGRIKALYR